MQAELHCTRILYSIYRQDNTCRHRATVKSALTIFSPSPIHLLVRLELLMEKKVACMRRSRGGEGEEEGGGRREGAGQGRYSPCSRRTLMLDAMAFPMSVLPVPGGPNSSRPRGGARAP